MKKSRVLALMLAVAMVFSCMSTFVASADELIPPSKTKVRVTEKTVTATFSEDQTKVWDIWDVEGNFGSYTTTGNALNITGGAVPFVTLSGFGSDLSNVNEIVFNYKTDSSLSVQLRIREKGYSSKVTLPATNGEYVDFSINPVQFEGGSLTAEDIKNYKSAYNPTTGKYDTTAMLYLDSQNASIKTINAYWYSYSTGSNQVRKEITENFENTTWGSWGSWTGGGSTSVPLSMKWEEGTGENGGNAMTVTGGNTGSGSYAGGQFMIPNSLDLAAVDAVRFRYKSTAGINAYFNRAFQINANEKLPADEFEIVKGFDWDDKNTTDVVETYLTVFDETGKNISDKQWKKESKSSGANLPSTNGEWKTIEIPISKFGTSEFLSHMKTNIVNQSFAPCYQVRFEGCTYGDFASTGKYFTWGGFTAVWFEKLPSMSSISFTKNGSVVEVLEEGVTEINVELANEANIDVEGSVVIAGLYERSTNTLIDVAVKVVNTPALGKSGVQTLKVELPSGYLEPEIRVMLWDGAASMNQITEVAYFDAYGYFAE